MPSGSRLSAIPINAMLPNRLRRANASLGWPSGSVEKLQLPAVDRIFTIEEGRGIIGELCVQCRPEKTLSTKN